MSFSFCCRIISSASSNFVLNTLFSSGMPASSQRLGLSHQSIGRYKQASTIDAKSPLLKQANTATWLLAIFPTLPQYWGPTPTLLSPFLTQPLSSIIRAVIFLFGSTELTVLATLSVT